MRITQERVRYLFDYNKETGELLYKVRASNRVQVGDAAGWKSKKNKDKIYVSIDYKIHIASRIIWLWYYGEPVPDLIDHKDYNPSNNRIENLRAATKSQNMANQGIAKHNTSGIKGVGFMKHTGKWRAYIQHQSKFYHLGSFDTMEEAVAARSAAAERMQGEFARHA